MLAELRVRDLGVIVDLEVELGPGLTVITGETGAGKTLVVEALELALGGRADPTMVRAGAAEAVAEARFTWGEDEILLARSVAANGRSRAFIDGRLASLTALGETGADLVDLHGQHAHQSLLRPATQRRALDQFAGTDLGPVRAHRAELTEIERELDRLGGDDASRARELDFCRFELAEIDQAAISSPDEEAELEAEERLLANVTSLREAGEAVGSALDGDAGAGELVGQAIEAVAHHEELAAFEERLRGLAAEAAELARELRGFAEGLEEDPARLAEVVARRQLLRALARKHGGDLAAALDVAEATRTRIAELESAGEAGEQLEARRLAELSALAADEEVVGDTRRAAATRLGEEVSRRLGTLALERARLEVRLPASGIGDDVEFLLAANPGEPALPLAKVASGGELARAMLALRLLLTAAPDTLVFDEVDAGIGGAAALAVGAALAELGARHQVLVVTHLAQVAAAADHHFVVTKSVEDGRTVARLTPVAGEERVAEISRMLSGHPDSPAAREHAAELLASLHGGESRVVRGEPSRAL